MLHTVCCNKPGVISRTTVNPTTENSEIKDSDRSQIHGGYSFHKSYSDIKIKLISSVKNKGFRIIISSS